MIDYTEGSNKQYHTQLEENGVGDYVILTGDPKRVKDIASYLDDILLRTTVNMLHIQAILMEYCVALFQQVLVELVLQSQWKSLFN